MLRLDWCSSGSNQQTTFKIYTIDRKKKFKKKLPRIFLFLILQIVGTKNNRIESTDLAQHSDCTKTSATNNNDLVQRGFIKVDQPSDRPRVVGTETFDAGGAAGEGHCEHKIRFYILDLFNQHY